MNRAVRPWKPTGRNVSLVPSDAIFARIRYSYEKRAALRLIARQGAAKRGLKARILREGTATVMPEGNAAKMKAKLEEAKIEYI